MTAFEEKYLNRVCDIVLKHIDKNKFHVFLFGSRARAEYPSRTDIDVGIFGDEPFAVAEPKAWLALQNELEEAWLPYTIDIIDFYTTSDHFKTVALQNYILWNKANLVENWQPSAVRLMAGKPYKTPLPTV